MAAQSHFIITPTSSLPDVSAVFDDDALNPKTVEKWLASVSGVEKAQQLLDGLTLLTHHDTVDEPVECIGLIEKRVKALLDANEVESSQGRKRDIYQQAQQLFYGIAQAYFAVLENRSKAVKKPKMQLTVCQYAMQASANCYFYTLMLHHKPAEHLWRNMHGLYLLAPTIKAKGEEKRTAIIINQYKRALLLSRSDAQKLRVADFKIVWKLAGFWAQHTTLQPESGINTYFKVVFDSDDGLVYAGPEPDAEQEGSMGLDLHKLIAQLQKVQQQPGENPDLSDRLVQHLLQSWGQIRNRAERREAADSNCALCFGFVGAHWRLTQGVEFTAFIQGFTSEKAVSEFAEKKDEVWGHEAAESRDDEQRLNTTEAISFEEPEVVEQEVPQILAKIDQRDRAGARATFAVNSAVRILPDELVLVEEGETHTLYNIQWLEIDGGHTMNVGLKKQGDKAEPAAIALVHKSNIGEHFQRAIVAYFNQRPSIILPTVNGQEGTKFQLIWGEQLRKGKLGKRLQATAGWHRYGFTLFDEE